MMYTVKKLIFSAFFEADYTDFIVNFTIYNCTEIVKHEFASKIAQRPFIANAHINYIYGGIYIMLKIRYMGYNNTHPDGINMERPGGMGHYLMLLVKSDAYFEFPEETIYRQYCCGEHENKTTADELLKGNLPFDRNARHPGLIRQYVNTPAFIIYTKDAPVYYYSDDEYVNDWINFDDIPDENTCKDENDNIRKDINRNSSNNNSNADTDNLINSNADTAGNADNYIDNSISDFMLSLDIPFNRLTLLSDYTELSQLIRDLRQEFHQTGSHHEEILDAKLRTILFKYSDAYHLETQLSDKLKVHRPLFHEIRNGIYSQHSPKKTVSELAEAASLSVSYFQHIYKDLFGVPVTQDIIRSRIERACYLLTMTPDSVAHIAESCGYENVEHFNRQFKEITGFSPNQYRKKK